MVLRPSRLGIGSVKNEIQAGDIVKIYTWRYNHGYDWILAICVQVYNYRGTDRSYRSFDCCVFATKEMKHVHMDNIKKVTL